MRPSATVVPLAFVLALVAYSATGRAQTSTPPAAERDADNNPTRPVLFGIRPEIYKPNDEVTQAALIFRYDRASFAKRRWLPGRRGAIFRFEAPISNTQIQGSAAQTGLGDAYGQILLIPHLSRTFAFVAGSGLLMPTATDNLLGAGKWVLAPAAGPLWFLPGPGLFFVKLQNFVSIAGDDERPDVNFLLVTPYFVRAFPSRHAWMLVDTETKTNWLRDGRTGVKSGVQIGRSLTPRFALWVKPEAWWGPNRDGRWNLKFGLIWYRQA